MKKIVLAVLWVLGWMHVLAFSPSGGESTADFIIAVMQADRDRVDPMVFMVFNLLGIWPLIMVAMLVQDTQGKLKAWPFAFSSMILGNSALYIYLFLRLPQGRFAGSMSGLVRFAESKILAYFLLGSTVALLVYGFSQGSFAVFTATWKTHFFVNVMTVDFFLFTAAFAFILSDDMRRRNMQVNGRFWFYALVPVLGAASYLVVRKPLSPGASDEH
ncbi:MAG: hypothetical protein R3308_05755 [Thiohalobacterales bacterium]|nr:hypothetical protein [Thiohalobacterales bacterium]